MYKVSIILLFLFVISFNILSQENFKFESEYNNYLFFQNNKYEDDLLSKKTGINITNEILEFEILDSFDLKLKYLHDLTYGDGYLWIIKSADFEFDTIFQINPLNGNIVNAYKIPIPLNYWSQALTWDSTSPDGPYFWFSTDNPINTINKMRVSDFEIVNTYKPSDIYIYGLDFKDSLLWIGLGERDEKKLLVFNQTNDSYDSLISLPNRSDFIVFSSFTNAKTYLWVIQSSIWLDSNFIYLIDINLGKRVQTYKHPSSESTGLALDNTSDGGPYLWTADFKTGWIYKLKEPKIEVEVFDEIKKNIGIFPDPFSESTNIRFSLDSHCYTKLTIYNTLGYEMATLVNEYLDKGTHEFTFDGSNLASGTYFYVLQSGGRIESGKLLLIK